MIFRTLILSGCLLAAGCASTDESSAPIQANAAPEPAASKETAMPEWLLSPPEHTVSACVKVKGDDLHTAKTIVVAKAKAALLSNQKVDVQARSMLSKTQTETTTEVDRSANDSMRYRSDIKLSTSGSIDYTYTVIEEAQVQLNQQNNLCVLFG